MQWAVPVNISITVLSLASSVSLLGFIRESWGNCISLPPPLTSVKVEEDVVFVPTRRHHLPRMQSRNVACYKC
jgi:hypothetical protein